jgi:hypothetical protein
LAQLKPLSNNENYSFYWAFLSYRMKSQKTLAQQLKCIGLVK